MKKVFLSIGLLVGLAFSAAASDLRLDVGVDVLALDTVQYGDLSIVALPDVLAEFTIADDVLWVQFDDPAAAPVLEYSKFVAMRALDLNMDQRQAIRRTAFPLMI